MKVYAQLMLVLGVGTVICGVSIPLAQAENLSGKRCVTGLNPLICDAIGNSLCNEISGSGLGCQGDCISCPGDGSVPAKYCVGWEGSCCVKAGSGEGECAVPDVDQVSGTCMAESSSCVCVNPVPTGTDCGDTSEAPSCSGNCS